MKNTDPLPLLLGNPKDWFNHVVIVRTDVREQDFPTHEAFIAEQECIARSEQVADSIRAFGITVTIVAADSLLAENLQKLKPDLCINFVDTVRGSGALASGVPGLFDLLSIPYVGAGTLALSLNSNKFLTKTLLENVGIPTPQYQLFHSWKQKLEYELKFPLIVKLNEEHGSVGISQRSVVSNDDELQSQLKELISVYNQPVLVEEFIDQAREITGVVLESTQVKTFVSERQYEVSAEQPFKLVTFDTKWATDLGKPEPVEYIPFATENKDLISDIKRDLRKAFELLRMDDLARFDIMVDRYDNYFFIDCNANPSLGLESAVARAGVVNNVKFESILLSMMKRNKLDIALM